MADDRKEKERRLNEAARLWKTTPPEGNEAVIESLRQQVFTMSFELFDSDGNAMAFMDAFEEAYRKYDADQGAFVNYLSTLFKNRKTDRFRYDRRHAPGGDSLDAPVSTSEDNDLTRYDVTASAADSPDSGVMFESLYVELTALVLNFAQNHKGRQANEDRRKWYRIFFTEDMTLTYKTHHYTFNHERDIFQAILLPYLDYYMARPCRTGREIVLTPLKPYGEVVPGQKDDRAETRVPLPADVSLAYLSRCEGKTFKRPARSNQLNFYREEVERISKC